MAQSTPLSAVMPNLPPFHSIEEDQKAAQEIYAEILWTAKHRMASDLAGAAEREAAGGIFRRLVEDALWAVTEVRRDKVWKYLRQRYVSAAVVDHWEALHLQGCNRTSAYLFAPDGGLRHEHVETRSELRARLRAATSHANMRVALSNAIACITTKHEHARLGAGIRWERYRNAVEGPVGVYDRLECQWVVARQ
ncbi:hypothetical protein [Variovorax saccharolyticus]|uniref:hypothetical protein n=1 Tax=Variovorax saccharolyticus TaxID=3053516 RepID=UPI0025786260|nr:hypothetical protein [Variovorax sp. J31P216]MDM0029604.1 hypothetical protein [Variovorax sp. J31P216]